MQLTPKGVSCSLLPEQQVGRYDNTSNRNRLACLLFSQKGVLLPQSVLTAQCESLVHAWKYTRDDCLLHILPLHHIHGILNALLTPLSAGSSVEFMSTFNSTAVWERLATPYLPTANRKPGYERVTFLTAVPTMYSHLLSRYQELPPVVRSAAKE